MPSISSKQHRFMAACSNPQSRAKMKAKCPPMKVAREFMRADKGQHFKGASKHKSWLEAHKARHGIR